MPDTTILAAVRRLGKLGLLLQVAAGFAVAAPSQEWTFHKSADGSRPNGEEQQMLWLMNRARTNPEVEGKWLAASGNADIEAALNYFKVKRAILQEEFAEIAPQPPAAFDIRLHEGMVEHCESLIRLNTNNAAIWHAGQIARAQGYGFVLNGGSDSVHPHAKSALEAHAAFNVDWGVDDGGADGTGMQSKRTHRNAIMGNDIPGRSWPWTNVGIAYVPNQGKADNLGVAVVAAFYAFASPIMADHHNTFLVGTVWTDANGNGAYDPGEGHGGVRVAPDQGTHYAITGDAGGYAIPVTTGGSLSLTFSGGDLGDVEVVEQVVVGGDSVLVPWNPEAHEPGNGGGGAVDLTEIILQHRPAEGVLKLSWEGDGEAVLQESDDGENWRESALSAGSVEGGAGYSVEISLGAEAPKRRLYRLQR